MLSSFRYVNGTGGGHDSDLDDELNDNLNSVDSDIVGMFKVCLYPLVMNGPLAHD